MKIQVISDIHLEHNKTIPSFLLNPDNINAPYLFLIGDIGIPKQKKSLWLEYINWCNQQEKLSKIFYVLGNHESYGFSYEETMEYIRNVFSTMPKFTLLERNIITQLEDYTIIGCTLWSDIDFATALLMNDIQHIKKHTNQTLNKPIERTISLSTEKYQNQNQNPYQYQYQYQYQKKRNIEISTLQSWYKNDKEWLEITLNELQSHLDKKDKIIVATHHLPSMKLIPSKFQNTSDIKYAKGFASNLDHLIPLTNLWLFGHTHYHIDTILDKTRCYANPLGYPDENDTCFSMSQVIELV